MPGPKRLSLSLPQVIANLREAQRVLRQVIELPHPFTEMDTAALRQAVRLLGIEQARAEEHWQRVARAKYGAS
jgi:hypothetical protein